MKNHENSTPDYDFSEGLNFQVYRFQKGAEPLQGEYSVSPEEFAAFPDARQDPDRDEKVAEQLRHSYVAHIGKAAVEYALYGNESSDEVTIVNMGWGGRLNHPVAIEEGQAIAAGNEDALFVVPNQPGTGKSSISPSMFIETWKGNFTPNAELVTEAVRPVTENKKVNVVAFSQGVEPALKQTRNNGEGVERVHLIDPLGARKLGAFALAKLSKRFMVDEGAHLREYKKSRYDRIGDVDMAEDIGGGRSIGGLAHQFVAETSGLTKPVFEENLAEALPYIHGELRVFVPERSELTELDAIAEVMKKVYDVSESNAVVELWVLKNHTHSAAGADPRLLSALYSKRNLPSPFANQAA